MGGLYGRNGSLRAKAGRADELARVLQEAAALLENNTDCLLYLIGRPADDENSLLVCEVWKSRQAHESSLKDDAVKSLIGKAMPLIDGIPASVEFLPRGGKGLPRQE